tara:strand:+ start:316 stop:501 length:186 start_codon:yes stop_codon:yes gene_type:complete
MKDENLNIAYWQKKLVLTALRKYPTQWEAAAALEISERTLIRYKHQYNIEIGRVVNIRKPS